MCPKQTLLHNHNNQEEPSILTVRALSGLSGDMMVAGLARMNGLTQNELDSYTRELGIVEANNCAHLVQKNVNHIGGWHCDIRLPHEHTHRTCNDIITLIQASSMQKKAKKLAEQTFILLAKAEGAVHGIAPEEVTFHEVGALDSIVDVCLACSLFVRLEPNIFQVSPLPLADGTIHCAHGIIPSPAPAVLNLLVDIAVCPFKGQGETITPTAIALIKTFGAIFGPWPSMRIKKTDIIYGTKIFPDVPNGSLWALGQTFSARKSFQGFSIDSGSHLLAYSHIHKHKHGHGLCDSSGHNSSQSKTPHTPTCAQPKKIKE